MKMTNKIETLHINVSKCYQDLYNFKDTIIELLTTFKIEVLLKQDELFRDLKTIKNNSQNNDK